MCKHKNLKPKVKLAGPKDVVANEGETLTLLAEVQVKRLIDLVVWNPPRLF